MKRSVLRKIVWPKQGNGAGLGEEMHMELWIYGWEKHVQPGEVYARYGGAAAFPHLRGMPCIQRQQDGRKSANIIYLE